MNNPKALIDATGTLFEMQETIRRAVAESSREVMASDHLQEKVVQSVTQALWHEGYVAAMNHMKQSVHMVPYQNPSREPLACWKNRTCKGDDMCNCTGECHG